MSEHDTKKPAKPPREIEPEYAIALSRDEINAMPIDRYQGPIAVARTEDEVRDACAALCTEAVLGFDTETRPSFRKGESYAPSLIQLAGTHTVYLFPLPDQRIPGPLKTLLSDPRILKTGVALDYDVKQLKEMDDFEPSGFTGLESLARQLKIRNQGLRGLAAALLGFRISKRAQCSNWSRADLTEAQIIYAATDAWISRELYFRLKEQASQQALSRPGRCDTLSHNG